MRNGALSPALLTCVLVIGGCQTVPRPLPQPAATAPAERERPMRPARATKPADSADRPVHTVRALPHLFEQNVGQAHANALFALRRPTYALLLARDGLVFGLANPPDPKHARMGGAAGNGQPRTTSHVVRMSFVGANASAAPVAEQPSRTTVGTIGFGDRSRAGRKIPAFQTIRYRELYPRTDLVLHTDEDRLRYDFIVAPGGDPGRIRFRFAGAGSVRIDDYGNLVMMTPGGRLVHSAPEIYHPAGSERELLDGRFVLHANGEVGFAVREWDRTRPLVIDPVIAYSWLLGGSEAEGVGDGLSILSTAPVASVSAGAGGTPDEIFVYVAGMTHSVDFNPTPDRPLAGATDAFLARYTFTRGDPRLVTADYVRFIGGNSEEWAISVAAGSAGDAYVAGETYSTDFPTAHAESYSAGFLVRVDATGAPAAALGIGAPGHGTALRHVYVRPLEAGASAGVYVAGETSAPGLATSGAYLTELRGGNDAIIARYPLDLSAPVFVTYLGGSNRDVATGLALRGDSLYVTGNTQSADFRHRRDVNGVWVPDLAPAARQTADFDETTCGQTGASGIPPCMDGYLAALSLTGDRRHWATFIGDDGGDEMRDVAVMESGGTVVVVGEMRSAGSGDYVGGAEPVIVRVLDGGLNYLRTIVPTSTHGFSRVAGVALSTGWAKVAGMLSQGSLLANAFSPLSNATWGAFYAEEANGAIQYIGFIGSGGAGFSAGTDIADRKFVENESPGITAITGWTTEALFPAGWSEQPLATAGQEDVFLTLIVYDRTQLILTNNASPSVVQPGGLVTFDLEVTNHPASSESAFQVGIVNTFTVDGTILNPNEVETMSFACGPDDANPVTCQIGTIHPGASATKSITVRAPETGVRICNEARLRLGNSVSVDPVTACVPLTTTVALSASKLQLPDPTPDRIRFQLKIGNDGTADAVDVDVVDEVSDEKLITLENAEVRAPAVGSCGPPTDSGKKIACSLPVVAAGGHALIWVTGLRGTSSAPDADAQCPGSRCVTNTVTARSTNPTSIASGSWEGVIHELADLSVNVHPLRTETIDPCSSPPRCTWQIIEVTVTNPTEPDALTVDLVMDFEGHVAESPLTRMLHPGLFTDHVVRPLRPLAGLMLLNPRYSIENQGTLAEILTGQGTCGFAQQTYRQDHVRRSQLRCTLTTPTGVGRVQVRRRTPPLVPALAVRARVSAEGIQEANPLNNCHRRGEINALAC